MRVVLLGTGAADGWPNPWCRCASCAWARRTGVIRTHTAALVDDRILVDCGPDVPRQADRAGVGLAGVAYVLLTHGHWDHADPAALLTRAWSGRRSPLRVVGPPGALARLTEWRAPADARDDALELVPVRPGDSVDLEGHRVRVLAAGHGGTRTGDALSEEAVLYDIADRAGASLLYATDTGPLPEATMQAVAGREYDLVLLDATFGTETDHGTGHLDLRTFPQAVSGLRRAGAVTARTDVVAVHLGHHNPPGPDLDARLADWGARTVPDLTTLHVPREVPGGLRSDRSGENEKPRRELVLGGARSGKSRLAESRLAAEPAVTYVATGGTGASDPEWAARVTAHRARRPAHWTTVETTAVADALRTAAPGDLLLVDCLALWLASVMEDAGCWDRTLHPDNDPDSSVEERVRDLVAALRDTAARVVLVSNEVGSGVVPEHASGRAYRDRLGDLNARVADECDAVTLVVAGRPLPLRP